MKRFTSPLFSAILAVSALCAPAFAEQLSVMPEADATAPAAAAPASRKQARAEAKAERQAVRGASYYVEFRSRYALSYGHTFLAHGRLGPGGRIITSEVAGLHPAGDDPTPWMVGHFLPVPSETGASDGDTEAQYISARYRINLTAEQYQKVSAFIRKLQSSSPTWHAVFYNCNAFVGDVAHYMGLQTPGTLEMPADYINGIRRMNGGVSRVSLPDEAHGSSEGNLLGTPR